ncbi:MAG: RecQ family ATP-dependent DNA helicase [Deltaproteobacteria bacterium]|nr:RecQ family ATP-dependent DNA helicase [Deltaproteobacteria bacterium]
MSKLARDRLEGREILRQALANPEADFRPGQWEAIDRLVNRRERLLVVERTGWGKSSVYFIATRLLRNRGRGPTIIISPLLALMRNQLEAAKRLGLRARTVNSANRQDWPAIQRALRANQVDALLISPERLSNDAFVRETLEPVARNVGMLVVDEAHCISDWGHDFRPDYRRIVRVLQHMTPQVAVLGTTATANQRVIDDVVTQLGGIGIQRGSLVRNSLALQNLRLPDQAACLTWLAKYLPGLEGAGIIYVLTKRLAEEASTWLQQRGIDARPYHAGVEDSSGRRKADHRVQLERMLLENRVKALVCTTALGMGFDKPDLGFVIHLQAPGSLVSYYQQVGRAGRALERAVGVLLSSPEDEKTNAYFRDAAFPKDGEVQTVLDALDACDGLGEEGLLRSTNLKETRLRYTLRFLEALESAPLMKVDGQWRRLPVEYRLDEEYVRHIRARREAEWREVQRYLDTKECLMRFLARALDDPSAADCGRCANCTGRPVVRGASEAVPKEDAARFLTRRDFPFVAREELDGGTLPKYGFSRRIPPHLLPEEGRVLSRWRDSGWGQVVADEKAAGHFGAGLVDATAEMIATRWRPCPEPLWLTCVPSQRHPELVPDFARRLAARLGLPFVPAVRKVRDNAPQKEQQNRFQQCQNLDGVFAVEEGIPPGPVLLVDDIVDSGWTLTVIAALLRRAGSGPVLPVALASTSTGD